MEKYRTLLTIFKALKIQAEIVILQEIQELQESVPRLTDNENSLNRADIQNLSQTKGSGIW